MTALQLAAKVVQEIPRYLGWHSDATDNSSFGCLATHLRKMGPRDNSNEIRAGLDGGAGHENARNHDEFSQRWFGCFICHFSNPPIKQTSVTA